jgi:hypothetical protein
MLTLFIEMSGPGAQEVLTDFAARLKTQPSSGAVRLLESAEQEGLFLLVVDWQAESLPQAPAGAKVWKFKLLRTNEHEF